MSVFHLKYRPQKIADLDSVEVSASLKKIVMSQEMPQAFLFAGPKGAGKTSAARIMARAVNCENLKDGEPCGKCDNCKEVMKGSCIDVIEIDAASNRGIEEARDLKEKAYLLPSKLPKKVFIIDEVHMMTKDAFNALLKLIEEPPKHTIFILCTTDWQKIPETVLSRLVKVDFKKGNRSELHNSLRRIVEGEKFEIEETAIDMIVDRSDGSFRNIQRTLNEIYLNFGKKLKADDVKTFFETKMGEYTPETIEDDLVTGDVKLILTNLEKMAEKGVDFKSFRENLLVYFQDKLLGGLGVEGRGQPKLSIDATEKWLQLLIAAGKQEKEVSIDQLPLELAVAEFLGQNPKIQSPKSKDLNSSGPVDTSPPPIVSPKTSEQVTRTRVDRLNVDLGIDVAKIEEGWGRVLTAVKPFNHSVEAFLRAARPKAIEGNLVTLEVFYPFHKDRLEEQKNRKIVETGFKEALGIEIIFECVLSESKQAPLIIKNDTPNALVNDKLEETAKTNGDIYDVAKEIFG